MWIIILIIAITGFIGYKYYDTKKEKEKAQLREQERKAQAEARRKKFEVFTEAEKQQLSSSDKDELTTVLDTFNKAINGNTDAMVLIGIIYQSRFKNANKAFYWIQKAANLGNAEGKYWLGELYVAGYGVKEDKIKGVSMIIDSARKGNETAIQSLKDNGMSVAEMRSCGIPV